MNRRNMVKGLAAAAAAAGSEAFGESRHEAMTGGDHGAAGPLRIQKQGSFTVGGTVISEPGTSDPPSRRSRATSANVAA
ncbi:hypothetical protein ACIBLA_15005 [Streptomyces sp. NPDC050433]|uniref:hypothetical protein n=1 Tax=Streptomyces sp. NPDC050433 TaxID=3365615 RepID=UPI0037BD832A